MLDNTLVQDLSLIVLFRLCNKEQPFVIEPFDSLDSVIWVQVQKLSYQVNCVWWNFTPVVSFKDKLAFDDGIHQLKWTPFLQWRASCQQNS